MSEVMILLGNDPRVKDRVTISGGTAIHYLHSNSPGRFSEDVDCVSPTFTSQMQTARHLRRVLKDHCERTGMRFRWKRRPSKYIGYLLSYIPTDGGSRAAVKVETSNSQPALSRMARTIEYELNSDYLKASAKLQVVPAEGIAATKLLAMESRRKARDLFDLWYVISELQVPEERIVEAFVELNIRKWTLSSFKARLEHNLRSNNFWQELAVTIRSKMAFSQEDLHKAAALAAEVAAAAAAAHPALGKQGGG